MEPYGIVTQDLDRTRRPLVVGLTGGIGSGKSTVADLFKTLGVPVIDADEIAHALVEPGHPALQEIITTFGEHCIDANGQLDRGWLRERVFTDAGLRHRLEAILHPKIRMKISELIKTVAKPYCLVVIPLLLETGQMDLVDRVLVVDCTPDRQVERAAARDGRAREEILAIMGVQATRESRLGIADDVISNDSTLDELHTRVKSQHKKYLEIAAHGPG
ncbi:MAG: dephospho-CoA kinase [Gammaproteobacteria bacterium]|nr:dephospho-CoA kinase [Gammaproteobacteria bacterium]